jgi:hypothetical protein
MASMKVEAAVEAIREWAAAGHDVSPVTFTCQFGLSVTPAAFRIARQRGYIAKKMNSCAGTPIYVSRDRLFTVVK